MDGWLWEQAVFTSRYQFLPDNVRQGKGEPCAVYMQVDLSKGFENINKYLEVKLRMSSFYNRT